MVASEQHLFQRIVQFDKTILLPRKLAYMTTFLLLPLVGFLFEILRRIISVI